MRKGFIQPINYIKYCPHPPINRFRGLAPPIHWTLVTPLVDTLVDRTVDIAQS